MHLKSARIHREKFPTTDWYPFNLPVFHETKAVAFSKPVTFFIGENGSGKSTFLRAIARACGIHIWENAERTRFRHNPYENDLHRAVAAEWTASAVPGSFFSSQLFQHFAEILDEWAHADPGMLEYFGGKSLLEQSHGQSLLSFFQARTKLEGLYLLDEPETALSPRNQLRLLQLIAREALGGRAQFIIATHSPILLACPDAALFSFDDSPVRRMEYEETEPYRVYRDFFSNRGQAIEATHPAKGRPDLFMNFASKFPRHEESED
jgi:predicted ATPase